MGSFSIWHWLIVLLIVALVFGTKKLRNIGTDLGSAVKDFKEGMREGEQNNESKNSAKDAVNNETSKTIDVKSEEKSSTRH